MIASIMMILACAILVICIVTDNKHSYIRWKAAHQRIEELEKKEAQHNQQQQWNELDKRLEHIRAKYPTPQKTWMNYEQLKHTLDSHLNGWINNLEQKTSLSEREIQFCAYHIIYTHLTLEEIASYMCYTEKSIRNYKYRIAKKLGLSSVELLKFLQNDLFEHLFAEKVSVCK